MLREARTYEEMLWPDPMMRMSSQCPLRCSWFPGSSLRFSRGSDISNYVSQRYLNPTLYAV